MIRNPEGAFAWWDEVTPREGREGDRAARAQLRRCATVGEAMLLPAAMRLFRRCAAEDAQDLPPVALCAVILAHVRDDRPDLSVARQLGPEDPDRPETAILKPIRFRRLLETVEPDDALPAFRRLVALADGTLNVRDLARSLLVWSHRTLGERRRRDWVFAYWNANPAATPAATPAVSTQDTAA